ncbi:hypothetical protein SAMN04488503_3024 [Humidesulfovibrio mexicanus]|uniref:Uncharacterized protein n=1 Tax=Humidesulfovibrio mexicanus TaxID=147047 RepID=A0A239C975_9BACT|nr:hypothetical protein [Humidesulfovibrio mexicanus]SNS16777.1 hypothetical protein SAMN04488503_3024 [Humidesulfovibrio mexicanus]
MAERKNKRDALIRALSDADANRLAVLAQARENAKAAVLEKSSKSNMEALRTAEQMLAKFQADKGLDGTGAGLCFKNINEVHRYLSEQGYKAALSTLYNDKKFFPKRKGVISLRAVKGYIEAKKLEKRSASAQQEAEADAGLSSEARRLDADAALKEKRGRLLDLQLAKDEGALFPAETAERELAVRAQAFRLGLEGWAAKAGETVAATFGADPDLAAKAVVRVGGDPAKSGELVAFLLSRVPAFVTLFVDELAKALDDYASGVWLTPDMAERMRAWEQARALREVETCREACRLVGAPEDRAEALAAVFLVARRLTR